MERHVTGTEGGFLSREYDVDSGVRRRERTREDGLALDHGARLATAALAFIFRIDPKILIGPALTGGSAQSNHPFVTERAWPPELLSPSLDGLPARIMRVGPVDAGPRAWSEVGRGAFSSPALTGGAFLSLRYGRTIARGLQRPHLPSTRNLPRPGASSQAGLFSAPASEMTRNHRYPARREAERRYPHHVDIPVPSGGLGKRLADMHDWCHDHVAAGEWEAHGHSDDRRDERGIHIDFARFYFMHKADAEKFRREWLPDA